MQESNPLHPLHSSLSPKVLLTVTGEVYGLRVADLNESTSTSLGRHSILESIGSNCSDEHSIFNLSQAIARIEKEVQANQFAGSTKGQCCLKHLRKSISDKINKSELFSLQSQRPSVITPTPPCMENWTTSPLNVTRQILV